MSVVIRLHNIDALCRAADLERQADLADALGVSQADVSRWLSGRRSLPMKRLDQLCQLLNCQPGDILSYVPDNGPETLTDALGSLSDPKVRQDAGHVVEAPQKRAARAVRQARKLGAQQGTPADDK